MIVTRPPSTFKPYDEYWSGDPAFVQAPSGEDEATRELQKEHYAKVRRARETGQWGELRIADKQPTKFIMKSLRGEAMRWINDQRQISDPAKALGDTALTSIAFRAALVKIENLGFDFKLEFEDHPGLGTIATRGIVDFLDGVDPSIVTELGMVALWRAQLNPL